MNSISLAMILLISVSSFLPANLLFASNNSPFDSGSNASSCSQNGITYRVDSQSYINTFSYVSVLASVQVNNTASTSSCQLPLSIIFPGYYSKYLISYNSSGVALTMFQRNNSLYFNGTLPSIEPGKGILVMLGLTLWGMVYESQTSSSTTPDYTFSTASIPMVYLPGAVITNATSTIGLPSSVTVNNIPAVNRSFYSQIGNNLYFYNYRNSSLISSSLVNISFSPTSGSNSFAVYRVVNVTRILTLGQNGAINVQDYVVIQNNDSAALTSLTLTAPAEGQYQISGGVIRPRYISLSSGTLSVSACYSLPISTPSCQPIPVEPHDHATFVIYYSLPSSAIKKTQSGLLVNVSSGTLNYPSLYGSYRVIVSFPEGSNYSFLTQSSFNNISKIPTVLISAKVPFGYQLDPLFAVAVAVLIIFSAVFAIYSVRNKGGIEAEVDDIIRRKKNVVAWLVEDIRQRGEGFAPYAYFTEERKDYEDSRNRLNAKINNLRELAKKDKSYRQAVDRLIQEDAKIEQAYKEARQILEDKLAGRVDEEKFRQKIKELLQRLQD